MKIDKSFWVIIALLYESLLLLYLIIVRLIRSNGQIDFDGTLVFIIVYWLLWGCAFCVHYRSSTTKLTFSEPSENADILDTGLVVGEKLPIKKSHFLLRVGNLLFGFLNLVGGIGLLFAMADDFDQSELDLTMMTICMFFTLVIVLFLGSYIPVDSAVRYIRRTND